MPRTRTVVSLALLAACGLAGAAIAFGFLGRLHPALDSFTHLRLHLAGLLVLGGVGLLALRIRREGLAALSLAACSVILTPGAMPGLGSSRAADTGYPPQERATYRLLHLNARFDNRTPEQFLSLIGRLRPDVVTVAETSAMWRRRLDSLAAAYPHRVVCDARGKIGGVAILSRRSFVRGSTPECQVGGALAIARVDLGGRDVAVAAVHLEWPWPFGQPEQVGSLSPHLARLPEETILAGDFNAVRWSQGFARVADAGGLRDAGPVGPSWLPGLFPDWARRFAGFGIDHVLAGHGLEIAGVERQEDVGSDHLPVLVEFWLPAEEPPLRDGTTVVGAPATASRGA